MSEPHKYHFTMPETQAARTLQVRIDELERENAVLKARLTLAREFLKGMMHWKGGACLKKMQEAEKILDQF